MAYGATPRRSLQSPALRRDDRQRRVREILEIEVRGNRGVGHCKSMPGAARVYQRIKVRLKPDQGETRRARHQRREERREVYSEQPNPELPLRSTAARQAPTGNVRFSSFAAKSCQSVSGQFRSAAFEPGHLAEVKKLGMMPTSVVCAKRTISEIRRSSA